MIGRLIDILIFAAIAFPWAYGYTGHIITTTLLIGIIIYFLVFLHTRGQFLIPRYFILPWLFVAYDFISVLWAPYQELALEVNLAVFSSALLGTAIWFSIVNGTHPKIIVAGFVIGGAVGIASVIQEIINKGSGKRFGGLFGNPNTFAIFCSYAAFAIWFGLEKKPKWVNYLAGLFIFFPILYTGSRKLILVLLVIALISLWAIFKHPVLKTRRHIMTISIMILIIGGYYGLRHLEEITIFKRSQVLIKTKGVFYRADKREELVKTGWKLWKQKPILGYGSGQYAPISRNPYYSHNNYIELLVNNGLIGLCLFNMLIAVALVRAKQKLKIAGVLYRGAFWMLLLILFVNFGMVVTYDYTAWIFMCFASYLGLHVTGFQNLQKDRFVSVRSQTQEYKS